MLDAVLERFVTRCPVAVLAHLSLQRALGGAWVDELFAAHAEQQYTRELLFSTVVDLMALVAVGLRPSLHAAAREALVAGTLGVSLQALYAKVNHTEPALLRALVRASAARLAPVMVAVRAPAARDVAPWLSGYRVRVLDGAHLAPSERRVGPLRGTRGAPLPGQAVVLYAPEDDLVVDLVAGEDAHALEHTLATALLATAAPGELWLMDRHYATRAILHALHARGAAVLVREPTQQPHPTPLGPAVPAGRGATGALTEQPVACPAPDAPKPGRRARPGTPSAAPIPLRRVVVTLDAPLASGETEVRLLTSLPAAVADAATVAALYQRRWAIEHLFQRLEAVLASEVPTLAHPRAALLAFSVAVVAYNALAVVHAAAEAGAAAVSPARRAAPAPMPLSLYALAHTIREHYRGMLVAVPPAAWAGYDALAPVALAATLVRIAAHVRRAAFRKQPRGASGPRLARGYVPRAELQHVSTARLLAADRQRRREQAP